MHGVPVSPYIIKQVNLDLCSLPKVNSYRHIMVCNGFFTKWLQTKPVRDNAAFTVTTFLHSHKKRKDSLETQDVLLTFSLKRDISGVAVQEIHENRGGGGWLLSVRIFLIKMALRLIQSLSLVMAMKK